MRRIPFAAALATFALLGLLPGCTAPDPAGDGPSPYAQWAGNEIRALPPEDVQALREGGGAGYALAAELNGYPGPRHVLDLADALGLDAQQRAQTQSLFDAMRAEAVPLGEQVLAAHVALESSFRDGTATEASIRAATEAIAAAEARLRAVHLEAHVATKALLTPEQVHRYMELRGYAGGAGAGHAGAEGGGHADGGHGADGHDGAAAAGDGDADHGA